MANTPAKRGDIAVYPVRHSTGRLTGPAMETRYAIGMVTHITREGLVKACRTFDFGRWNEPAAYQTKSPMDGCTIAAATRFATPVRKMLESMPADFATIDECKAALIPFLKA